MINFFRFFVAQTTVIKHVVDNLNDLCLWNIGQQVLNIKREDQAIVSYRNIPQWYAHVKRMDADRMGQTVLEEVPERSRFKGSWQSTSTKIKTSDFEEEKQTIRSSQEEEEILEQHCLISKQVHLQFSIMHGISLGQAGATLLWDGPVILSQFLSCCPVCYKRPQI